MAIVLGVPNFRFFTVHYYMYIVKPNSSIHRTFIVIVYSTVTQFLEHL